jgi:hypothetical protein
VIALFQTLVAGKSRQADDEGGFGVGSGVGLRVGVGVGRAGVGPVVDVGLGRAVGVGPAVGMGVGVGLGPNVGGAAGAIVGVAMAPVVMGSFRRGHVEDLVRPSGAASASIGTMMRTASSIVDDTASQRRMGMRPGDLHLHIRICSSPPTFDMGRKSRGDARVMRARVAPAPHTLFGLARRRYPWRTRQIRGGGE